MSRNIYLEELKYLLEQNWQPDRPGRPYQQEIDGLWYELPAAGDLDISVENEIKEEKLQTGEAIRVVNTQGLERQPSSVGYNEERVVARGAIRVKATDYTVTWDDDGDGTEEQHTFDGRRQVFGFFNDTGSDVVTNDGATIAPGEYAGIRDGEFDYGLIAEVEKVFHDIKSGGANWDLVVPQGFTDISENMNFGTYAAECEIVLTKHASSL